MIFPEQDSTLTPASLEGFELHRKAPGWIQQMITREGLALQIGVNLHGSLTNAGLNVEAVRAAWVQPPDKAYALGSIFKACLPGIVALGVEAPEEVGIDTLQRHLDDERLKSRGIHVGAAMFGAWAHVRRLIPSADTGRRLATRMLPS
nr:hypothetical protein [uncultured Pseudomonas sp.]